MGLIQAACARLPPITHVYGRAKPADFGTAESGVYEEDLRSRAEPGPLRRAGRDAHGVFCAACEAVYGSRAIAITGENPFG